MHRLLSGPPTSHVAKGVDTSTPVRRESRNWTTDFDTSRSCLQAAKAFATAACDRGEIVTVKDGKVIWASPPPALLPVPHPATLIIPPGGLLGLPGDYAIDVTPKGYVQ